MQILHRAFSIAHSQKFPHRERTLNGHFNRVLFVATWPLQYPIGDGLMRAQRVARMSDADAYAPIVTRSQLRLNIAQTIVSGMTAAEFEFDVTGVKIKLVVCDENLGRCDRVEIGQGGDALARVGRVKCGFSSRKST